MQGQKCVHMLAKPIGPRCNLNCTYCFYTEKTEMFPQDENYQMSDEVLEVFIRKYIQAQPAMEVAFVWQGGEPTLMGLEFYQKAVVLQKKYAGGKKITNSLQTNGTLLDDAWCIFLKEHNFLVGLSLDGPDFIHDRYRRQCDGAPSFQNVMKGLRLLKKHEVDYNVLCCITKEAAYRPDDIYRFFKNEGVKYIQFIPIVERNPDRTAKKLGLHLAAPPAVQAEAIQADVTEWTVESEAYGNFLIKIFDRWVRQDVGKIYVMNFEWALTSWMGLASTVCVFAEQCGESVVMEHDGGVYACDHYVYPDYYLGNILTAQPGEMAVTDKQKKFGLQKSAGLPEYCLDCEAKFACQGECPKHRFLLTPTGEAGLNYLCAGYKKYFRHIHPYMKVMRQLIENGLPASRVKDAIKGPIAIKKAGY